ncbi:MAG TPA: winged helix-turn-helix domain-containing protein [Vicinamibacterales bacterium]|nr:winged helix-turn-helix domain-containing protein [Vicinamibacterales bacterium]
MTQSVGFGEYRFQLDTGQLWLRGQEVRLTPKAAGVLQVLLSNAGSPVSKADLFSSVWPDVAVTDDALTTCIQELRRLLGDDAKRPQFIETRHRRGYRFIAPVSREHAPVGSAAGQEATRAISSIAVLPFADMSPSHDQEYLCEGLAEELINALTQIDGLRVAARTASFQFRGKGEDIRLVGEQLNVATLLEGSVRKAGERLRVTVQLIEVASGYQRWSHRFDGQFEDVFAVQDEIAESVAKSLRGDAVSPRETRAQHRARTATAAYELYLRGRQHLPRIRHADLVLAADMFRRAIELDPGYGPAYAGLATAHSTLYEWFGANDADLAGAERASERALELAPYLAEAHVARGCALSLMRRYEDAGREFEEAIRLNPNLFDAHYYYARTSFARDDVAGSAALFRKAADVRQEDFQSAFLLAQSLKMLRKDEEASAWRREGIRRAEHVLALNPLDGRAMSLGALYLLEEGQTERAVEWSARALELYPDDMSSLGNGACLQAKLGHADQALRLLERVSAQGWGQRDWLERDPDYDSLRDDPRFKRLLTTFR